MKYSQNALTLAVMAVGLVAGLSIQASADALILDSSLTISVPATYDNIIVQSHGRLTADAPVTVLGSLTIDSGGVVTHSVRLEQGLVLNIAGTVNIRAGGLIDVTAKGLRGGTSGSVFGVDGESYDSLGQIVVGAKGGPGSGNQSGAGASYGGLGANSEVATGLPYGLLEEPVYLGAGGGGAVAGSRPGGHGGGRATITVTNLVVDGTIRANGGNGVGANPQSGGGSGGSIKIQAGTLSGMGSIEAVGGLGFNSFPTPSGSGGGGRIAIFYGSNSLLSSHISARGGGGVRPGSAGTVYLKDDAATYGDLIVDNGNVSSSLFTPLMTDVSRLQSVSVTNVGKLAVDSSVTLAITNLGGWDLNIASGAVVELVRQSVFDATTVRVNNGTLNAHISLGFADGASLELSGGGMMNVSDSAVMSLGYFTPVNLQSGTLNIPSGCRLDVVANIVTVGNHVTLVKDGTFGVSDQLASLTIDSGGLVTHSLRLVEGLVLDVSGNLEISAGGLIDLNAKGLRGGMNGSVFGVDGESFDSLGQIVVGARGGPASGNQSGAGASYGGLGANSEAVTGQPYGLLEEAVHLGAGGGGAIAGSRPGGNGGGRATITAGALIIDGTIRANGGSGVGANPQSGGGSGGSIRITAGNLSGSGFIEAAGGPGFNSFPTPSGSAGGGRIAIYYGSSSFSDSHISARGGGGVRPGSAGTVYLKDSLETNGDLIIDNGSLTTALSSGLLTDLSHFANLRLSHKGRLWLKAADITSLTVEEPLYITDTSAVIFDSGVITDILNAGGFDLNVENGSSVTLYTGTTLNANSIRVSGGSLSTYVDMSFPDANDFELSSAGVVTIDSGAVFETEFFDDTNVASGTFNVTSGCRLDVATNSVTIGNGVTLIKDGVFGASDQLANLTVNSGGMVTHSLRLLEGLVLNITGTLDVRTGGLIDINAKGLRGGQNGSVFGNDGEAYDSLGQIIAGAHGGVGGNNSGAGASYGGLGANSDAVTGLPYSLLEEPVYLGAGGGGATNGARAGGHGGGRATISATSVVVNGTIRANGGNGIGANPQSGGGSGGSIRIETGALSGTGTIEAVGGLGVNSFPTPSGSGGGGRIAIFYGSNSLSSSHITARGGGGVRPGSAGTVYLKDSAATSGDLIIDNGSQSTSLSSSLITDLTQFSDLRLSHKGRLWLKTDDLSSLVLEKPLSITDTSALIVDSNFSLSILNETGYDLYVENGSVLSFYPGSVFDANDIYVSHATIAAYRDMTVTSGDSIRVLAGGRLSGTGMLNLAGGFLDLDNGILDFDSAVFVNGGELTTSGSVLSNMYMEGGTLTLHDSLIVTDMLNLNGGTMRGSGVVRGSVLNSSLLDPGFPYDIVVIDGSYVQTHTGNLKIDVGGLQEGESFDKLRISGDAVLDGLLTIAFDDGFVPDAGDRLQLIKFEELIGAFAAIDGLDSSLAVVRVDTCLVLIAGGDLVDYSSVDPVLVPSPAGNIPFSIHLRDSQGTPVPGVDNVWLDFTGASGLSRCGTEPLWPIVTPDALSDADGRVTFSVRAGGCTTDSVAVMTSHGVIGRVPIRSLDRSGGLLVTARDFEGDACNDYNNDGVTDAADWTFFARYIGLSCLDDAANYLLLDVYTVPGPHDIFQGDTIQICGSIENSSSEAITLDSVNFSTAGWGIARPWTTFSQQQNITVAGDDTIDICSDYVVPESHHGCFRIKIFPRFASNRVRAPEPPAVANVLATSLSGLSLNNVTTSQIVQTLRRTYDLPINFVQSRQEGLLSLGTCEGTMRDLLEKVVRQDPGYRYETINGRVVLRAADSRYDAIVSDVSIHEVPRLQAAHEYIGVINNRVSGLSALLPPAMKGSPSAAAYVNRVTLNPGGRVLDHLVQLLGEDSTLTFGIEPCASGRPMYAFYGQQRHTASPTSCANCRPTAVNYDNLDTPGCPDPGYCGAAITYDITHISSQCCDTLPCDCEDGRVTEEVTNDHGCSPGDVKVGPGCDINAFGSVSDCRDLYRVCLGPDAWPADSCTETLTQKLYVCDKLIQTVTIKFTLRRDAQGGCSGSAPVRSAGQPVPPAPCGPASPKEKQINRDAIKRAAATRAGESRSATSITRFEIPVGTESGDSLLIFRRAFLPNGWSFTCSDSAWIHTPDTIVVEMYHEDEIQTGDTGRVIFYAYDDRDEFTGEAEVMVYDPGPIVDVQNPGSQDLPTAFEITQNYPNPFNPVTTIEYSIPTRSQVMIEVFNVLGQKVRTLVDESKSAGEYRTEWNGGDDAGKPVSTGIYLYRFQAGDVVQTKKMLLIK